MRLEFDREPNVAEALRWLFEGVADLYPRLKSINNKLEDILSNQDELDARTARIEAANVAVAAAIADLKAQVAAGTPAEVLDFSRLDAAVSGEEALEPVAAPVVDPAAPAV